MSELYRISEYMTVSGVNTLLAWLTLGGQVFLAIGIVYWIIFRKEQNNPMLNRLGKNGMAAAWAIAVFGAALSLFYSNIAGFAPCDLCWYQRISLYPHVVLLGMALFRKDYRIAEYAFPLAAIGALIALYQNALSYGINAFAFCGVSGVSCARQYVHALGYITIPMMSLTAFLLMIFFLGLQRRYNTVQKTPSTKK